MAASREDSSSGPRSTDAVTETPRREVEEPLAKGEDVLLRVDVQGARSVKSAIDDAVLIFIAPPSEDEVRRRLEARASEAGSEIAARMGAFESEMAFQANCDHVVVNHTDGQERGRRRNPRDN